MTSALPSLFSLNINAPLLQGFCFSFLSFTLCLLSGKIKRKLILFYAILKYIYILITSCHWNSHTSSISVLFNNSFWWVFRNHAVKLWFSLRKLTIGILNIYNWNSIIILVQDLILLSFLEVIEFDFFFLSMLYLGWSLFSYMKLV